MKKIDALNILTAKTRRLLVPSFSIFHEWAEKRLNRPIFTHEFADERTNEEIENTVSDSEWKEVYQCLDKLKED